MANTPHWKLTQLQRIAAADPLRVEILLDSLWESHPEVLQELAICAVDQDQLSRADCAALLRVSHSEVDELLSLYRQTQQVGRAVVVQTDNQIARLADGHVAVWELVREFRRLGSMERLEELFPSLSLDEISAAMTYAEQHSQEIETLIDRYEKILERRKAEYPYSRKG